MNKSFSHKPRKIFNGVIFIWVILFAIVISEIVAFDLQRAEREFMDYFNIHYQQVNARVHINESVLEGFFAMVGTTQDFDRARIRSYAQKMLIQYPHIFMFEVIEKVHQDQLKAFSEYYRKNVFPEFKVKSFSYETDRLWRPVMESTYHMPIIFMEPFPLESRKVLGLDLSSNDFFMRSLDKSESMNRSMASDPFRLVEGDLAYLIHRPVLAPDNGKLSQINKSGAQSGFVMLVIQADTLLESGNQVFPGMNELLYNSTYSYTDPRGHLYLNNATKLSWLESSLFPYLRMSKVMDSESQPFVLLLEQQLGWGIISWGKLSLILMVAVSTFAVLIVYARLYYRNEVERIETTERLFHRANHDALTGLANRSLFHDRLSHAISQAARQKGLLAVLFLDLKGFKAVNDNYGHDTGDRVIKLAAERLQSCVRSVDTIARQGGDEFIIVQEKINGQQDVDHVVEKIKNEFEQPFAVNSHLITVGVSIGTAIYPINGTGVEMLVNHADSCMYKDKRTGQ